MWTLRQPAAPSVAQDAASSSAAQCSAWQAARALRPSHRSAFSGAPGLAAGKQPKGRQHTLTLASQTEQAEQPSIAPKPKLITKEWQQVLDMQAAGAVVSCEVVATSKGGLYLNLGPMKGYLPFSLADPARIPPASAGPEAKEALVGTKIAVKIVEVNVPERRVVLSERAASLSKLVTQLAVGDVVEGVVSYVSDFGAFVMLKDPEGLVNGAEGLVHISELSWEWVSTPDKVVQPGKVVRVKVVGVDKEAPRITLSLKQMESDPLRETLDDLVPLGGSAGGGNMVQVPANVPEEVEEICAALADTPGVSAVTLGRQAEEKRVVSQDLELWITKEVVTDGYNLLARAGRVVQEIHVSTSMSRTEMKETIQALLKRIV